MRGSQLAGVTHRQRIPPPTTHHVSEQQGSPSRVEETHRLGETSPCQALLCEEPPSVSLDMKDRVSPNAFKALGDVDSKPTELTLSHSPLGASHLSAFGASLFPLHLVLTPLMSLLQSHLPCKAFTKHSVGSLSHLPMYFSINLAVSPTRR